MLGFLDSLFAVALPLMGVLMAVISIILSLIVSAIGGVIYIGGVVYSLVRRHVEQSINDLQGHHIRR